MMPQRALASLLLFLTSLSAASRPKSVCGTYEGRTEAEVALSRFRDARRMREAARPALRDIGEIAVIDDSGGVIGTRNDFNLEGRAIRFQPSNAAATAYRFTTLEGIYDDAAATDGARVDGLGDDDTRGATLPFPFPFYGTNYRDLFVNSDGNLTFGEGDGASADRSLGRAIAGPPRIAALFRDLDPSRAGTVRVLSQPTRFVVSWVAVPDYRDSGIGPLETFQIRLYPDGAIELAFETVRTDTAITGISPGRLTPNSTIVSFVAGSAMEFTSGILERFDRNPEIDLVRATQRFYESHDDAYDFVAFFNNRGIPADNQGAIAFENTVRNTVTGIGFPAADNGAEFGSQRRLQAALNMGPLNQYPRDPNAPLPGRPSSGDTTLTVIAHEAGHRFLAFVSVPDPTNPQAQPMLGRQRAHWSFFFNSEASLLEGNRIEDRGPSVSPQFTNVATVEGYAPLDRYLMGLAAPAEVLPSFYVRPSVSLSPESAPLRGFSYDGSRVNVTIDEVVATEGRRTPDHTVAQRRFRMAFILITATGVEPGADQIQQIDAYRQAFEPFFERAAGGRATLDASLRRSVGLSAYPASGLFVGDSVPASVAVAAPVAAPLTILLRTTEGRVESPASVTIPTGASRIEFLLRGLRAGTDDLIAEPADSRYEVTAARIQVLESGAPLTLTVIEGDRQVATGVGVLPISLAVRVSDMNRLPYPGQRVEAVVSGGGSVVPLTPVTGEDGVQRFRWTTGVGPVNSVRFTIAGRPGAATATATALGRPFFATASVVNAASLRPELAPDAFVSIYGASLAGGGLAAAASLPLPLRLAGVEVRLNGVAIGLHFVSDSQINILVPATAAVGAGTLEVISALGSSGLIPVNVRAASPGLFVDGASGLGAIVVAGSRSLTDQFPVNPGETIEIYGTGFPAGVRPQVTIGGRSAEVTFSGYLPGFAGLFQINAAVPLETGGGPQTVVARAAGIESNAALIRVGR